MGDVRVLHQEKWWSTGESAMVYRIFLCAFLWFSCFSRADKNFNTTTANQNATNSTPYAIFANRNAIYRVNLDESEFKTLVNTSALVNNTVTVDFDIRRKYLFWSDVSSRKIIKANLDGSEPRVIVNTGLSVADGLAWDWLNEKLYWTDSKHKEIEVMDVLTGDRRKLIDTGFDTIPRALILDPDTRYLYWTDWGHVAKIERAFMDGSSRETLHDTGLVWPNGITIDYATQTLYWVDANLHKIESSYVNGSNRRIISTTFIHRPFAISYYGGILYWSDRLINQVIYAPVDSPKALSGLVPALKKDPLGIKVIAWENQPINTMNPCETNNGGCSNLCLLGGSGQDIDSHSCLCPTGQVNNGTVCILDMATLPPTPAASGSCREAGYTECCVLSESEECEVPDSECFCDESCLTFEDCCHDFHEICQTTASTTSILLPTPSQQPTASQQSTPSQQPTPTTTSHHASMVGASPTTSLTAEDTALVEPTEVASSSEVSSLMLPTPVTNSPVSSSKRKGLIAMSVLGFVVLTLFLSLLCLVTILSVVLRRKTSASSVRKYEAFDNESNKKEVEDTMESTDSGVDFKLEILDSGEII